MMTGQIKFNLVYTSQVVIMPFPAPNSTSRNDTGRNPVLGSSVEGEQKRCGQRFTIPVPKCH